MAKGSLKSKIMPAVGLAAGAVASGYVTKLIPVQNDKIKAAAPLIAGFLLMGKKGIVGDLGAGMVAGGAISLAQSFGIGAIDTPVMELDEIDNLEVEGIEDPQGSEIHGEGEDMPEDNLPE